LRAGVRSRFREHVQTSMLSATQLDAAGKLFKKSYAAGRRDLEHEFGKTMRFKSIRELAAGDTGRVVRDLKPIWLMSPLSVSDTLPLAFDLFDVVIFDEASQIPVEEAVPALYRAPQVIVVAHSMGGLAARAWMRATGGGRLARLITLGSPHAGTIMAGFGHGGSVRQMRLASPWLERLGGDESTEKRAQITSVFSHHDNIIAPQLSASLAGATNIALAGLGHVALVYEHAVWDLVLDIAQTTARAVPAPAAHA